jgi:ornithine carbamoyltransferase
MNKSITSVRDMTRGDIEHIYAVAADQKAILRTGGMLKPRMLGQTVGMLFEKPSLRTRVSFEVATTQLGGHVIFMGAGEVQIGKRESVADFARTLSRYVDMMVARTFKQEHVEEIARESRVPVINALSDFEHPCQALGDMLTIQEHLGGFSGKKACFVGDGNNVARSLCLACGALGVAFAIAAPEGYGFSDDFVKMAKKYAPKLQLEMGTDASALAKGADVVYTDVWTSMGQEAEVEQRKKAFRPYQINAALMKKANRNAIVMHCLPAKRGEELTDEVIDGPQSVVYDQAENRLHAQRALMTLLAR